MIRPDPRWLVLRTGGGLSLNRTIACSLQRQHPGRRPEGPGEAPAKAAGASRPTFGLWCHHHSSSGSPRHQASGAFPIDHCVVPHFFGHITLGIDVSEKNRRTIFWTSNQVPLLPDHCLGLWLICPFHVMPACCDVTRRGCLSSLSEGSALLPSTTTTLLTQSSLRLRLSSDSHFVTCALNTSIAIIW